MSHQIFPSEQTHRKGGRLQPPDASLDVNTRTTATKKRNELWYRARDLVRIEALDWSHFWEKGVYERKYLERLFTDYVKEVRDKVLVLHKEENGEGEALVIPYLTRAHSEYIKSVRKKLKCLKRIHSNRAIMMTLTTDPSRHFSLQQAYRAMLKNFHKLMTWLTKKYGCHLDYLAVPEFTKKGIPHIHVVVMGVTYLINQTELSDMWSKYGQAEVVDIRRCGQGFRNSSVYNYVLKYVEKAWDCDGDSPQNLYHIGALWALNGRSYNVSKGLLEVKERVKQGYTYVGSFARNIVQMIADFDANRIRFSISFLRLSGLLWEG